jgi:hypothetical protein
MTQVTPATFPAGLKSGAQLELADGLYGDVNINSLTGVTLTGGPGAKMNTLNVRASTDIGLSGFTVDFTPGAVADVNVNASRIYASKNVKVHAVTFHGEVVPEGAPGAKHPADIPTPGQNSYLVGYYAGRGMAIESSSFVSVTECLFEGFFRGIVCNDSPDCQVVRNRFRKLRTTGIGGGAGKGKTGDRVLIQDNVIEGSTPWRYAGDTLGDHLDGIHWFNVKDGPAIVDFWVFGNLIDQTGGYSALGFNLEDKGPGYVNARIEDNLLLGGDNQGITLTGPGVQGTILRNKLLGIPGGVNPPTLIYRGAKVSVEGNTLSDVSAGVKLAVTFPNNTYIKGLQSQAVIDAARVEALARIGTPEPVVDPKDAVIADLKEELAGVEADLISANAIIDSLTRDLQASQLAATQTRAQAAQDAAAAAGRAQMLQDARDAALARIAALEAWQAGVRAAVEK